MRQKLALLVGGLALGALVTRFVRRRRASAEQPALAPGADARAEALRRRLAESRSEAPADSPAEAHPDLALQADDVDAARRKVHEHGRAAVDEMRRSG